jgi:arylsulfatase A-like enzyme
MLRSVDFKYCVYREGDLRESLVNMSDDPGEMKNLATAPQHANTLNKHRRYLKDWITSSGDQDAESFALAPDATVTN